MNTYQTFYKDKKTIVEAETSYKAQQLASKLFKAKKSYEITVLLIEFNGQQVTHMPTF